MKITKEELRAILIAEIQKGIKSANEQAGYKFAEFDPKTLKIDEECADFEKYTPIARGIMLSKQESAVIIDMYNSILESRKHDISCERPGVESRLQDLEWRIKILEDAHRSYNVSHRLYEEYNKKETNGTETK